MPNTDFERLLKKAEGGDTIAQNSLAAMFATGDGVDRDFAKAVYWYKQASLNDDPDAFYNLALMYLYGEGVDKDEEMARSMLDEAIECGSSDACLVLAEAYEGSGIFNLTPDIDEAIRLYLNATLLGALKGIKSVGNLLSAGRLNSQQLSNIIESL